MGNSDIDTAETGPKIALFYFEFLIIIFIVVLYTVYFDIEYFFEVNE